VAISSRNAATSSITALLSRSLIGARSFEGKTGRSIGLTIGPPLRNDCRPDLRGRSGAGVRIDSSFMAPTDAGTSGVRRSPAFPDSVSIRQNRPAPNDQATLCFLGYSQPRPAQPDTGLIRRSGRSVG
jgi:hypothetical protein